ncbi:MAG: type I DNA topoisomerase [Myxococcota bacterium]
MSYHLLIVESSTKAKKISQILEDDERTWRVVATVGHFRRLPPMDGQSFEEVVDVANDFRERFITQEGKERVTSRLKSSIAGATAVYLALDPDREGEAIAWHVAEAFRLKNPLRVTYTSITADAVRQAIRDAHEIDLGTVDAQRARQVLDYLIGMEVSRRFWRFGAQSAGRVQGCALRIVATREETIDSFKSTPYWTLVATYDEGFTATVGKIAAPETADGEDRVDDSPIPSPTRYEDRDEALGAAQRLRDACPHRVALLKRTHKQRKPPPPFTTSTLLAAGSDAGFSQNHTTEAAQALFEAGLITYPRTDSPALSDEGIAQLRAYIETHHPDLLPAKPQVYKAKGDAQEAHEAIRPADIALVEPPDLKPREAQLYAIIWKRALVSQCKSATLATTHVVIEPADGAERLVAAGTMVEDPGWYQLAGKTPADSELPKIEQSQRLSLNAIDARDHRTKPPPHFTEKSLLAYLERRGIGRPATYPMVFETLRKRGYVREEKKKFRLGELGRVANHLGIVAFERLTREDFTRKTEDALDLIARGELSRTSFLKRFYSSLQRELEASKALFDQFAKENPELDREARVEHDTPCSKCGSLMLKRVGRNGPYARCTACEHVINLAPPEAAKQPCPLCRSAVQVKKYTRDGKQKKLYVCSSCEWKSSFAPSKPRKEPCPECGSPVFKRKGKDKKTAFWGCSKFPKCKYSAPV